VARSKARVNERGEPLLLNNAQIKLYCHNDVLEGNPDDPEDMEIVKMRPTEPFYDELQKQVYDMLMDAIAAARRDGRTTLMREDVPGYDPEEDEDEDEEEGDEVYN